MNEIKLKRIYEAPDSEDGVRILVDRLWPRGLSKETANLDLWLNDLAPSNELRKWYNHDPEKWPQFRDDYFNELNQKQELIRSLLAKIEESNVTFLFSNKHRENNNAVALKQYLEQYIQ